MPSPLPLPPQFLRERMLDELQLDLRQQNLWVPPALSFRGRRVWVHLLGDAFQRGMPSVLADGLAIGGRLHANSQPNGSFTSQHSADTLAWAEFVRFQVRATCLLARGFGHSFVVVHGLAPTRIHRPCRGLRLEPGALLTEARRMPHASTNPYAWAKCVVRLAHPGELVRPYRSGRPQFPPQAA